MIYNGATFTYVKNLQGDIVGILDANGDIVVKYQYDAWGRLIKISGILRTVLGKANPFRYRGYAYDEETGLYYLRSRYYDPEWDRFLNSDDVCTIQIENKLLDLNLFCYCGNSIINREDLWGYSWSEALTFTSSAATEIGNELAKNTSAYAASLTSASLDGPLFLMDMLALSYSLAITATAVIDGIYNAKDIIRHKKQENKLKRK